MAERRRRRDRLVVNLAAVGVAAAISIPIGWLVHHALFVGQAQSFDALIHARSLWGLAHGEPLNPVVGVHALAVHGYFLALLLVPFARVAPAIVVLVAAQTAALFATVFLTARRAAVIVGEGRLGARSRLAAPLGAVFAGLFVSVGSPLVLNPFLFDARPELLGLPIVVWALLRMESRGGLDRAAAIGLLVATLAREEYAMVAIGAVVLVVPRSKREEPDPSQEGKSQDEDHSRRHRGFVLRGIVGLAAVGWWGFYAMILRRWIGGDVALARLASTPSVLLGNFEDASAFYKGEIVLACVLGMGGLVILGWRWVGAAVPGLVFLLVQNRMGGLILNFHYAMFAAPGVVVAGIAGLRRLVAIYDDESKHKEGVTEAVAKESSGSVATETTRATWKDRRPLLLFGASVAIATLMFFVSSAAPGGHRYRRAFFIETAETRESRAIIERVPREAGVALPYAFAAPLADRTTIVHAAALVGKDIPAEIEYLALALPTWPTLGRFAVEQRGFQLVDLKPGVMALLRRGGPASDVSSLARAPVCTTPITRWDDLGLSLCSVGRYTDTRAVLVVRRDTTPTRTGRVAIFGKTEIGVLAFVGYEGVFNAEQLPVGKAMRLLSRAPSGALPIDIRAGRVGDDFETATAFETTLPPAAP